MPVGAEAVRTAVAPSLQNSQETSLNRRASLGETSSSSPSWGATALTGFLSREDVKKQRELEEARKSGLIPAEKDEEGKDINPHIPQYIAKAPWYLSHGTAPSLKHQRFQAEHQQHNLEKWYKRGFVEQQPAVLKYRKGSCSNCGAISHKAKECTERPRSRGARWTGR